MSGPDPLPIFNTVTVTGIILIILTAIAGIIFMILPFVLIGLAIYFAVTIALRNSSTFRDFVGYQESLPSQEALPAPPAATVRTVRTPDGQRFTTFVGAGN